MKNSSSTKSRGVLRKLTIYGCVGLFACYVVVVAAGFCWLRFVRENQRVALFDVALFRFSAIRRDIAAQHFIKAQAEWDAKNFQAAYLLFFAGVRQDPDNISGRLTATQFLRAVGAGNLALTMLEEGLTRSPGERRLIQPTFELLLASGRGHRVIELLKERYGSQMTGQNGALLQRYEVEATLADSAPAARQLLEKYPALSQDPLSFRVIARIFWDTQERLKAIGLLQQSIQTQKGSYADYALLAGWQESSGQTADAVQTARRAIAEFPADLLPRILLIEMVAAETPADKNVAQAIAGFLREFGSQPQALPELAVLAGRKGWVDLSRTLYELSANRQQDLGVVALSYSDALAHVSRFKEAREVLTDIDTQMAEGSPAFIIQLRQRQVIACAALGDSGNVREHARRLAAVLNRDPEGLEVCRRLFRKIGIADAVAELSSRSLPSVSPVRK